MDIDLTRQAFIEHDIKNPIVVCRDGEEALDYISAHNTEDDCDLPVLALLDLRLPKVDGMDVLREARAHSVWKRIPIIILTTSCNNQEILTAYEYGVNSYIQKPMDFDAFATIVKTIKVYWLLINRPPY
jgi:DNA-binding response OmpR family regulator